MNIVIIGTGKFGKKAIDLLVKENHNVVAIDNDEKALNDISSNYDVKTFYGYAANLDTLKDAGVTKFDLLIATTPRDELNALSCMVAKRAQIKHTVARIRNPRNYKQINEFKTELGIDMVINPDMETALEIYRILSFPGALHVETFAKDKLDLVEIKIEEDSPLKNLTLTQAFKKYDLRMLVCAVQTGEDVIIPRGDYELKVNDNIYLACSRKDAIKTFRKLELPTNKIKSTIIVGGSNTAFYLASFLEDSQIQVKIIESKNERCEKLSNRLNDVMIINGDGTKQNILLEEGIENIDSFVALTGIDETNLIVSKYVMSYDLKKTICKVSNQDFDAVSHSLGIDSIVVPQVVFANHLIRYVRAISTDEANEVVSLYKLVNEKVEALEFAITSEDNDYVNVYLKDLKLQENLLIASIIRNNQIIIPNGDDMILKGDHIVVIALAGMVNDASDILK